MIEMKCWTVYLLRCSDESLYCGITKDLDRRVQEHNDGIGCRYTRPRRPVRLVWSADTLTKSEAYKEEYRIKRMSKATKEALVAEGRSEDLRIEFLDNRAPSG
jgi:putative endonuclease